MITSKFSEMAKYWFGDREVDVDSMINAGSTTLEAIVNLFVKEKPEEAKKYDLTRDEAKMVMEAGLAVTHWLFSGDEYLYMQNGKMYSEEGYRFDRPEGWDARQGGNWEDGWLVYTGEVKRKEENNEIKILTSLRGRD